MSVGNPALAFLAGMLSVLSPCVLPLIPLVFGAAAAKHRYAPLALIAGLCGSFVLLGLVLATVGHSVGLNIETIRYVSSVLIILLGAALLIPSLHSPVERLLAPIVRWADGHLAWANSDGLGANLLIGALLGAAWSPCLGPTLGAASLLAAEGRNLWQVAIVMFAFGIGASLPLLLIGALSHKTLAAWRTHISRIGNGLKAALGGALVVLGSLVVTGMDKLLETALVDISPSWLIDLTTRF